MINKPWQPIISAIILITVAVIVLPKLLGFILSMGRLAIMIIIIVSLASGISLMRTKYRQAKVKDKANNEEKQ